MPDSREEISRIVTVTIQGTLVGPDQLIQAFYPELKRLAAAKMKREGSDHTWQPTVLVNELYLELVKVRELRPVNPMDARERAAFFALASQVMHWLLVRHTRPLSWRAEHEEVGPALASDVPGPDRLAQIENYLAKLESIDSQLRSIVELRVFEGLSVDDIAARLGCSSRTVGRHWRFAKSWLQEQLYPGTVGEGMGTERSAN
ncbi:MAG: ECF-type sigma factor [Bryobacteraceae bacterium]